MSGMLSVISLIKIPPKCHWKIPALYGSPFYKSPHAKLKNKHTIMITVLSLLYTNHGSVSQTEEKLPEAKIKIFRVSRSCAHVNVLLIFYIIYGELEISFSCGSCKLSTSGRSIPYKKVFFGAAISGSDAPTYIVTLSRYEPKSLFHLPNFSV